MYQEREALELRKPMSWFIRDVASGYFGVTFDQGSNKWRAFVDLEGGSRHEVGLFATKDSAARAYDLSAARILGAPLNALPVAEPDVGAEVTYTRCSSGNKKTTSRFAGVCLGRRNRWEVQLKAKGEKMYHKFFTTEKEAALAYDEKVTSPSWEFRRNTYKCHHEGPEQTWSVRRKAP